MKRVVFALLLAGCAASTPRPAVLGNVDDARTSPAVRDAEQRAPQAYARAEQLRARAEAAHRAGDSASAQILGEHALAAYERAVVLARLATAQARHAEAEARLRAAEQQAARLDEQQKRVQAETEQLELRARVLRDTLPLPSNTPSTPERERARLEAARALALQARLLCASAGLLEPGRATLSALGAEIENLDARLAKRAIPAPIDDATRLRSQCLSELSQVRRPKTLAAPGSAHSDQLLEELSNAAYAPARDDRGIVVTMHRAFANADVLSDDAQKKLTALGRVAATYPDFPVLVVLHTAGAPSAERDRKRLDATVAALRSGGATRIASALGGDAAPAVDPKRKGARERNERVEVVFVTPSSI